MADNSLDLNINIGANTQDFASQLQKAENLLSQFQSALKKSTNVGEINYLTTQINNLNGVIDNLNNKMSNVKKPATDSTNALTNLSRVAQDAPYGFMGIANNLNPMLESFQRLSKEAGGAGGALKSMVSGLAGPAGIGVALGVVSSLIVAFGDDIANFVGELMHGEDATKQYKEAFSGIGGEFTSAVQRVNKVQVAFEEYHRGVLTGEEALKVYNKQLGATLGVKSNVNDAEKIFKEKTNDYVQSTLQRALADAASKKAAEELLKQKEIIAAGPGEDAPVSFFAKFYGYDTKVIKQRRIDEMNEAVNESKKIMDRYLSIQTEAQTQADQIAKKAGIPLDNETQTKVKDLKQTTVSSTAAKKAEVDTSTLETLKKEQKLYEDNVYAYKEYADKIAKEQRNVNLEKAKLAKASANEIANIEKQYEIDKLLNEKELGDKLTKMFDAQDKQWTKQQQEDAKEKLATQLQASKDGLDIVKRNLDEDSKLAGDDYEKKKEAIKKAMAEIKILMAFSTNPKAIQDLDKAYKDMDKQYKILDIDQKQKDTKKLQDNYKKFADTIANDITQGFMVMFNAMSKGENPLQALGNYLGDLVKQFAAAIIQATIFKGIMSLLNLATGGGGGFLGGVLGGVGKLLGMAEGGVVSQPTLAMVGEGGQSEAIMPLNKLSNMMNSTFNAGAMSGVGGGGGNGQFVLKGNDLVLALQRSNYSLNLRRGNGI